MMCAPHTYCTSIKRVFKNKQEQGSSIMRKRKKRNIWDRLSPARLPCSIKKCFVLKFPGCPRGNVLLIFPFHSQIFMCLIKVFGKLKGRLATIVLSLHSWLQRQEVTWICHTGYESLGSQVSWVIKSQLGENLVWLPVLGFIAPNSTLCLWPMGWLCDSPTFSQSRWGRVINGVQKEEWHLPEARLVQNDER